MDPHSTASDESRRPPTATSLASSSAQTTEAVIIRMEEEEVPMVRFSNLNQLFQDVDATLGDALFVEDVSVEDFHDIDEERTRRLRKFRLRRFVADRNLLIIAIQRSPHVQLHIPLFQKIYNNICAMGLEESWMGSGAATCRPRNRPDADAGEADSTGAPWPQRRGPGYWPTLVILSGVSFSQSHLRGEMRWWFGASNHQVKIVILVKARINQGEVILEKYREHPAHGRPGAINTRASEVLEPQLDQSIVISQTAGNPATHHATGALVLEFDQLFLRAPGPEEHDVVLDIQYLQHYADMLWRCGV
ncbi:hypothetical protein AK830_g11306 [Neonectria ditissima]|uniref:Uncharacterized protein n=1 Tax=Neonectria ditissima TaxID=78410 RepID=A0A0P7B3S0_9HYPO|nr:hypothetical protein AK830_g11306 [Neonectria ditissima]